jgi:NTE family protein
VLALVLSGAANYGAMQAGALEALFNTGFNPQIIVGTSAGAINSTAIAVDPTAEGARRLGQQWETIGASRTIRLYKLNALRHLLSRKLYLIPSEPLVQFFQGQLPPQLETFGQLGELNNLHVYTVAVRVADGHPVVFGDHASDRLLDGIMASIAMPPIFEPWMVAGQQYIDGGIATNVPVCVSIERGATQIIALVIDHAMGTPQIAQDLFGLSGYAISLMIDQLTNLQLDRAAASGAEVRVIRLRAPDEVTFWDYEQAGYLYQAGYQAALQALESQPLQLLPSWQVQMRMWIKRYLNRLSGNETHSNFRP